MTQRGLGNDEHRAVRFQGARRVAVLPTVAALAVLPVWVAPAEAERQVEFDVTASADGLRFGVTAANFLVIEQLVDVGVPSAQATANSTAGNQGFASNPYPGDTVIHAPVAEAPRYPLYAHSMYPTEPKSEVEQEGYSLSSASDESSSESEAAAGVAADPGSVGRVIARARSEVDMDTGVAAATAENDAHGLTINEVLQLGRVHSTATVKSSPDGKVTRSSDLSIADTKVAGQRVAITPEGVVAAGQSTGLPPADDLNEVLANAGVQVRYLAPEKGRNGVVAAGVEVIAKQKDPTGGSNQEFTVRYVFGRASAAAGGSAEDLLGGGDAVSDGGQAAGPPNGSGASGNAEVSGASPTVGEEAPVAADGPAPAAAQPPEVAEDGPSPQAVRWLAWPGDLGAVGIYVTLVIVALATLVGGTLVRLLGVRTRWMS